MFETIITSCEGLAHTHGGGPEVLNMATGLVILGVGVWFTLRPRQPGMARLLGVMAVLMGLSALLSHSRSSVATEAVAIAPVILFFGVAFYAYSRDILVLSRGEAVTAVLMILPFVAVSLPLFILLDGPAASAGYAALPVFLLGMAVVLRQRHPDTAWRVLAAALLLIAGLALRALDMPLCEAFPHGTHAIWHLISAAVIAILICTYRRHLLAAPGAHG